jgi:hypothetical protein
VRCAPVGRLACVTAADVVPSEVADARAHRLIDKEVHGLEVAVENAFGVQISHSQCDPNDNLRCVGRRQPVIERERSGRIHSVAISSGESFAVGGRTAKRRRTQG